MPMAGLLRGRRCARAASTDAHIAPLDILAESPFGIILVSVKKLAFGEIADMTQKPRSRPVPAASKARTASGAPRVSKQPKAKQRKAENRGLEEALSKIAEIWRDARRRGFPSKS